MANPLINGHRYSHTSIATTIDGSKYIKGIKSIDYGVTVEPGEMRGSARLPQGKTHGAVKYEASFEMYREEFDDMAADMGAGYMSLYFDIQVERAEENSPVCVDSILSARIKSAKASTAEGSADAHTVKVELDVMRIKINGLDPVLEA